MKVLKIDSLEKGWCDKDYVMLHAAFQLLVDFVEKEKPGEIIDWNSDEAHKNAWKEIKSLYRWWKKTRPARKSPLDDKKLKTPPIRYKKVPGSERFVLLDWDKKKYADYEKALNKHGRLEKRWLEEDQRRLHRLVEIRRFLWT